MDAACAVCGVALLLLRRRLCCRLRLRLLLLLLLWRRARRLAAYSTLHHPAARSDRRHRYDSMSGGTGPLQPDQGERRRPRSSGLRHALG